MVYQMMLPNDIQNDADTWKINLPLYPVFVEDQFQAYSKKNWRDISKIKPPHQQMLASYLCCQPEKVFLSKKTFY